MVAIGIQQATSTLVGFSIGNQKPKNAKEIAIVSIVFTTGLYTILGGLVILYRDSISALISSDPAVTDQLHSLLIVVGIFSLFDALNGVIEGILRGMGLQQKAVVFKLSTMFIIRLPIGVALSRYIGVSGIWIGAIAGMLSSCACYAWVLSRSSFVECARQSLSIQSKDDLSKPLIIHDPVSA